MRMYSAKHRAVAPSTTALPATVQVGNVIPVRPAFAASALIAAGVISGVPVIFSCLRLELTVERPLAASRITATPNATMIAAETNPPISSTLFVVIVLLLLEAVASFSLPSVRGRGGGRHPELPEAALRPGPRLRRARQAQSLTPSPSATEPIRFGRISRSTQACSKATARSS